jgi:hypothetical protein
MTARDALAQAAGTSAVVRIVYHGGSQPGTVREIVPIIIDDTHVVAQCLASGVRKTFRIDSLEILAPESCAEAYRADPSEAERPIPEVFLRSVAELEDLGWHVRIDEDSISLHGFLKNGRPRAAPVVRLWRAEFTAVSEVDEAGFDTGVFRERLSALPYHVSSPRMGRVASVKAQRRAVAMFWEEARALAPRAAPTLRKGY